ncbi:S9 family peptidase [Ruicaihuangia caeni]|uniref:S9 family peptidase n=1 Tax=Ruicaihuangia caeni TaxID=3042517 RepID=UPI00338E1CEB
MELEPPIAPQMPTERIHHGDIVVDPYEWLRDKSDPAVIAHLEAENAYTEQETSHLATLRQQIFDEIKSRTLETDLSVPVRQGQWWYYTRTFEGKQYGVHCRAPISGPDDWAPPTITEGDDGLIGEQVLLDDNAEAEGHDFYSLGSFDVSDDGSLLLYGVDVEGDERYTLRIRKLGEVAEDHPAASVEIGDDLPDVIEGTGHGALFSPDGRWVFYTTVDEAWRPDTVWRHAVGSDSSADVSVFHEPDERFFVGAGLTRSRKYLVIELGSNTTSEAWTLDAENPEGEFTVVWPRREGVEYEIEHAVVDGEQRLLIVHNDQAPNFELVSVSADDPQGERRVLMAHRDDIRLEGVDAFSDHIVVEYRRDGLTRVAIATSGERKLREIDFDEPLFTAGVGSNPEWHQPVVRLGYTSFVTPSTVYDYVIDTGELRMLKRQPVLGGYDPSLFEQRREWAEADDGTMIPISLVYRADLVTPGTPAPMLLYGYGAYEHSIDPGFSVARLSLLDRGMIFAIAHVRGGGELGRHWYEQGKLMHKKNTFLDFIACAQHLIDEDYTSPDRLVAEGRSAGGLLMGAIANKAPGLFAGILAGVPFVDALTTILDPSLPLTVIEWEEWGDPLHSPEAYAYMKSYSPYENVREQQYPRILAVTSLNDTRVYYVEPAKWVAKLRTVGADALLKTEMAAGHGGVSGRYRAWEEHAFDYAWIIDVAGAHPSSEGREVMASETSLG